MQNYFIWIGAAVLIAAIFIPYIISFKRQEKLTADRHREAKDLGIDRPRAQYPMIDRSKCIGCGACVDACPEGDVLGVVWGMAEVINGQRCVGHGYCEKVCPVGALKVGLGDITSRPDIPVLSPVNESSVDGLFIAGELGGLSLIKNAIAQGKMVVDEVARRINGNKRGDTLDLIIVGAGPAGLSAALAAVQHNLKYLVIDEKEVGGTVLHYPRQKLVMTQPVEIPLYGWLKEEEYSKEQLMETWQNIVTKFNVNICTSQVVSAVRKSDGLFEVTTPSRSYFSRYVVLAMGRRGAPRKLDVPGEELPKVIYQLIDAKSYSGKHLLVVGGGDSAVEAAVGLARQSGNTVTVSYRKSAFFRVKKKNEVAIEKMISTKKVTPIFDSEVAEIRLSSVVLKTKSGTTEIPNDHVIVLIGGVPPFELLRSMGIQFGGDQKPISTAPNTV